MPFWFPKYDLIWGIWHDLQSPGIHLYVKEPSSDVLSVGYIFAIHYSSAALRILHNALPVLDLSFIVNKFSLGDLLLSIFKFFLTIKLIFVWFVWYWLTFVNDKTDIFYSHVGKMECWNLPSELKCTLWKVDS